jgi:hypothetical protein
MSRGGLLRWRAVQAFYRAADAAGHARRYISICIPRFAGRCIASLRCSRPARIFDAGFLPLLQASGMDAIVRHTEAGGTFTHFTCEKFGAQSATLELGKVMPFGANDLSLFAGTDAAIRALIADARCRRRQSAGGLLPGRGEHHQARGRFYAQSRPKLTTSPPPGYEIARQAEKRGWCRLTRPISSSQCRGRHRSARRFVAAQPRLAFHNLLEGIDMTQHQREGQVNPAIDGECPSQLKRGLGARHIQMIALGGAIGTGLFMGAGRNIAVAGTSILVIYVLGFFTYMVMRAMGEVLLTRLDYRSFADFVGEYLGPQASFYLGWTYWLSWVVTCIADVVVCGSYMQYWFPECRPGCRPSACWRFCSCLICCRSKCSARPNSGSP